MIGFPTTLQLAPADWTVVAGTFGLSLAASLLVIWATRKYLEEYARKTTTRVDDVIVSLLKGPVVFLVIAYAAIFLVRTLASQPSSSLLNSLDLAYVFSLVLVGTWTASKLFIVAVHRYLQTPALKTQTKADDIIVGVFARTGRILMLIVGVAIALGLLWMAVGLLRIASGST